MLRFLAGFALASAVWAGGVAYAVFGLGWAAPLPEEPEVIVAVADEPTEEVPETGRRRRGRARAGGGSSGSSSSSGGGADLEAEATTGDDLGDGEMRMIDGEGTGGEEQLTGAEIDAAFDGAMGRIRRCFILAPAESTVTGRLTFGMRIAGTGHPSAVSLTGPSGLTSGECGDCLRDAARAIAFPTFDGPEMVVRYPITLE